MNESGLRDAAARAHELWGAPDAGGRHLATIIEHGDDASEEDYSVVGNMLLGSIHSILSDFHGQALSRHKSRGLYELVTSEYADPIVFRLRGKVLVAAMSTTYRGPGHVRSARPPTAQEHAHWAGLPVAPIPPEPEPVATSSHAAAAHGFEEADDEDVPDEATAGSRGIDADEVLGDLSPLVSSLFNSWWLGSEAEVVAYFWDVLKKRGEVHSEDALAHAESIATLLALHRLMATFDVYAHDEGSVEGYELPVWEAMGDFPLASPFALGMLANKMDFEGFGADEEDEFMRAVLRAAATDRWKAVGRILIEELGVYEVFACLWLARSGSATIPPTPDAIGEVVNEDPWEKMSAYEWLTEKF